MSVAKYKKPLILFSIVLIFTIVMLFLGIGTEPEPLSNLLPSDYIFTQTGFLFIFIMLSSLIGGLVIGYGLAPLYLFIHKKLIGGKLIYKIQKRPIPDHFKGTFKAFFPALMAINFALFLAFYQPIIDFTVSAEYLATPQGPELAPIISFIVLLIFISGISLGLFSPVWFLVDSGIVFLNKEKVKNKIAPIEIRSAGGWYSNIVEGYAGIGVIIAYIYFLVEMFNRFGEFGSGFIFALILLSILPFLVTILAIPTIIILDMTTERRRNYMLKWARKMGITEYMEVELK